MTYIDINGTMHDDGCCKPPKCTKPEVKTYNELLQRIANLERQLNESRAAEYKAIVAGDAARFKLRMLEQQLAESVPWPTMKANCFYRLPPSDECKKLPEYSDCTFKDCPLVKRM